MVHDADYFTYGRVIPNLECAKYAAWRKKKRDIVVFSPSFEPEHYSQSYFRKDYDDGNFDNIVPVQRKSVGTKKLHGDRLERYFYGSVRIGFQDVFIFLCAADRYGGAFLVLILHLRKQFERDLQIVFKYIFPVGCRALRECSRLPVPVGILRDGIGIADIDVMNRPAAAVDLRNAVRDIHHRDMPRHLYGDPVCRHTGRDLLCPADVIAVQGPCVFRQMVPAVIFIDLPG